MSEKITNPARSSEIQPSADILRDSPQKEVLQERGAESETSPHGSEAHLKELVQDIEKIATSRDQLMQPLQQHNERGHHPVFVSTRIKELTYSRTLTRARKQMMLPSRLLSRALHTPILERPSEIAAQTVARPSGLFMGALFACVGSSLLLWTTRHYGYEYNYFALFILFGGGMVLGLLGELAWSTIRKNK